jgi:hypothetical protein
MGQHFIVDDGGVIMNEHVLDGQGRDVGDENTPEGICDRGIYASKAEGAFERLVFVKDDL